ncbi:MAG: hypothetical protein DRJ11_08325 [Candidatus Aminicenantes bacterium]|nr:MAG: hypothetical protein DRJ11_08325 [Candidatus Aminicenantes bacterium]
MKNTMRKVLVTTWILLLMAGSFSVYAQQNEKIKMFEEHIIEMRFSEAGVVQTGKKSPLIERMKFYKTPGVCITVVDNDTILWTKGYGVRIAGKSDVVTEKTIFQAGSVSKFVTALIVLHYVEQGILDLDENINTYLTSWKMPANKYGKIITLRQLLSHQSGLPGTNFGRDPSKDLPTLPQILNGKNPARNLPAFPTFSPGTKWSYSNIGYVVIQLILEDVLHKEFNNIATQIVFEPLHMNSSTFTYPLPPHWKQHEAWPHENGIPKPAVQDTKARAQGGLMTTTHDMALLAIEVMKAYHGTSETIISQPTVREMLTKQAAIPLETFGLPFDMGLGVFLDNSGSSLSFLHPGQSYPGSAFLIVAFPETKQAVVIAINGDKGDQLELEILATLAEIYQLPSGQYYK